MEREKLLEQYADAFCGLFYSGTWAGPPLEGLPSLSPDEAYQVQDAVARRRVARGEQVIGYKVGCTSPAIRRQFGLNEPINARLFSPYLHPDGAELDWSAYRNGAIEPELVLTLASDLEDPGASDEALVGSIAHLRAGIELHHFIFCHQPPCQQELIASGGIHAGLLLGRSTAPAETLLTHDPIFRVRADEVEVTAAPASDVLGGPLHSLRWLIGSLARRGLRLRGGDLVIPGSPTELVTIDRDLDLTVRIDGVGDATAIFRRGGWRFPGMGGLS